VIPLYKLDRLPRTQKLRKIAKVLGMAENRFAANKNTGIFKTDEFVFFFEAAKMLSCDSLFPEEAQNVFKEAAEVFDRAARSDTVGTNGVDADELRRALNAVKHLLFAETGRDQADWDFTEGGVASVGSGLDPAKRQIFEGMLVYLEDIRSPFNVGAMFRTAESFGVEKMILSPFCADPRHRRAQRTAMGCIDIVPWERQNFFGASGVNEEGTENPPPCPVFALETGGTPIEEFSFPRRGLLIAGSEELGVSPRALAAADASLGRVSIPRYGAKASLNVSVAFGIALASWSRAYTS
jgi:TrmH family RNA methyltransferase